MKLAILLTGTVKPSVPGGSFTAEERMKMYTSTLEFYATKIKKKYPIVFVENSDTDISWWKDKFHDLLHVEILQYNPNKITTEKFDNTQGKGFNEYLMIKKALNDSVVLSHSTHFLKITGRYPMLNINQIIAEIEFRAKDKNFFGDIKDTRLYDILNIKNTDSCHWGDSRFFLANINYEPTLKRGIF